MHPEIDIIHTKLQRMIDDIHLMLGHLLLGLDALNRVLAFEPQPRGDEDDAVVEGNEAAENAKVAPNVAVVHAETPSKLVTSGVLTEFADAVRAGLDVATRLLDGRLDVLVA